MEKSDKQPSELVITKTLRNGKEKILLSLNRKGIFEAVLCFVMQFAGIFSSMSPFGIAFYASVFSPEKWMLNYIMSVVGTIIAGQKAFWGYASCITSVTIIFALFEKLAGRTFLRAITTSAVFVTFTAVRFINSGFSSFDIFALILEALIVTGSVFMFEKSFRVLTGFKKRSFISESESMLTYTFIALVISAIGKAPLLFGFNIGEVSAVLIIFIMAMGNSQSPVLTLSVLLGALGIISGGKGGEVIGTYAFGALLASVLKRYGKVGVVLGFVIANASGVLIMYDAGDASMSVVCTLAAAVIFGFVPQKVIDFFSEFSAKTDLYDALKSKNTRGGVSGTKRLCRIAESIGDLGEIYEKASKEKLIGNGYMKFISGEISAKVCMTCKNKEECFGANGIATEAIKEMWQKDVQRISAINLPKNLRLKCPKSQSFAEAARGCMLLMKTEKQWLSKLNESRKLIAFQLKSISDIVKDECEADTKDRDGELEMKLWTELDALSLSPREVFVRKKDASFEAEIGFVMSDLSKESKKTIAEAVERVFSAPVRFAGIKKSADTVYVSFVPTGTFKISFGYATRAKNGEKVSGDSFNVICAKSSSAVMALSDGMGSGEKAKEESKTVIDMLEKFLYAGFSCEKAVSLINSSLLLRGEKDSFATLDICDISLEDATLSFTKLGSSASYIKTNEGTTEIKGESLPAGILKDVKVKKHMLPFFSDTLVVLISDGVADISLKNLECEGWIEKELEKLWGASPQIVAGKLLEKATKLSGVVHDDMTVLVGCISR